MPSDEIPHKLVPLLFELIASGELPELAVGGAWWCLQGLTTLRPALGPVALEADVCGLTIASLRATGSVADWVSSSRGDGGKSYALGMLGNLTKLFSGQPQRPDLEAIVASGLFDECASAMAAVAAGGVEGLHDANLVVLCCAIQLVRNCRSLPGCEAKIRQLTPALAFHLEHDLDFMEQLGMTTGSFAAQICTRPCAELSHPSIRLAISACLTRPSLRLLLLLCLAGLLMNDQRFYTGAMHVLTLAVVRSL